MPYTLVYCAQNPLCLSGFFKQHGQKMGWTARPSYALLRNPGAMVLDWAEGHELAYFKFLIFCKHRRLATLSSVSRRLQSSSIIAGIQEHSMSFYYKRLPLPKKLANRPSLRPASGYAHPNPMQRSSFCCTKTVRILQWSWRREYQRLFCFQHHSLVVIALFHFLRSC